MGRGRIPTMVDQEHLITATHYDRQPQRSAARGDRPTRNPGHFRWKSKLRRTKWHATELGRLVPAKQLGLGSERFSVPARQLCVRDWLRPCVKSTSLCTHLPARRWPRRLHYAFAAI